MKQKNICIYHRDDNDGLVSGSIVKYFFNHTAKQDIEMVGWTYGDLTPDLSSYTNIVIVDLTFPHVEMLKLARRKAEIVWIDHHQMSLDIYEKYNFKGLRNTAFSAAELTWSYFFFDVQMPRLIYYTGRYDIFAHYNTDEELTVNEFEYGLREKLPNFDIAYELLEKYFSDRGLRHVIEGDIARNGKVIYNFQKQMAQSLMATGLYLKVNWVFNKEERESVFLLINQRAFNFKAFGFSLPDNVQATISYHRNERGDWKMSLRAEEESTFDCREFARMFGGGGHKKASSFILDQSQFFKFLNGEEVM